MSLMEEINRANNALTVDGWVVVNEIIAVLVALKTHIQFHLRRKIKKKKTKSLYEKK